MDEIGGGRYAHVPEALITANVSDRAVRLWTLLRLRSDIHGCCTAFQKSLAADLDCSTASLKRALTELRDSGWVNQSAGHAAPQDALVYQTFDIAKTTVDDGVTRTRKTSGKKPKKIIDRPPEKNVELTGELDGSSETFGFTRSEDVGSSSGSPPAPPPSNYHELFELPLAHDKTAGQSASSSPVNYLNNTKNQALYYIPSVYKRASTRVSIPQKNRVVASNIREKNLDPSEALTLWDPPESADIEKLAPRRKSTNIDGPYGLAQNWRRQMEQNGLTALDANMRALMAHYKAFLDVGVSPEQLRIMNSLYAATPGLRTPGKTPWRDFLDKRHQLLEMARVSLADTAAAADPGAYYADWVAPPTP